MASLWQNVLACNDMLTTCLLLFWTQRDLNNCINDDQAGLKQRLASEVKEGLNFALVKILAQYTCKDFFLKV